MLHGKDSAVPVGRDWVQADYNIRTRRASDFSHGLRIPEELIES